jgi:hypothetical protein
MDIEISSIGLATAQGSAAEILAGVPLEAPRGVPWSLRPGSGCQVCRPARGYPDQLAGPDRWRALAQAALQECLPSPAPTGTPLVVASCNGAAHSMVAAEWIEAFDTRRLLSGTPWAEVRRPVVSGSCASGLHALFLAAQFLTAGYDEVVVLAVDILSPSSHDNFDALRVLASHPATPWQPTSPGFIPGEAAVALRVTRSSGAAHPTWAREPALGQDLGEGDGLRAVVAECRFPSPSVVVGQGTGPAAVDDIELSVLDSLIDRRTPVTTPQLHFGHTLGASGLLSVSLAALVHRTGTLPPALAMPAGATSSDRPLAQGAPPGSALIMCRALSGACAATRVGGVPAAATAAPPTEYRSRPAPEPMGHVVLRRIAAEAARVRPAAPPDLLLVRADAPLLPSPGGSLGGRLLPHAVLSITPGSIPRLIARCWGYGGPALCLVGEESGPGDVMIRACRAAGRTVAQVRLRGTGYERELEWHVQSQ